MKAFCVHGRPWFRCDDCADLHYHVVEDDQGACHGYSAQARHLDALRAEERESYAQAVLFGTRFPWLGCRIEG